MSTLPVMASADYLEALTNVVVNNLVNQQDWTDVKVHHKPGLPRQIISGLPPHRLYVHPDEQIAIIKAEKNRQDPVPQPPEVEWVLPTHLSEKWTLGRFAAVFDAIEALPPTASGGEQNEEELNGLEEEDNGAEWKQWRGAKRGKRIILATVQDDSTVVYYFMHDGIVKPRQN